MVKAYSLFIVVGNLNHVTMRLVNKQSRLSKSTKINWVYLYSKFEHLAILPDNTFIYKPYNIQ